MKVKKIYLIFILLTILMGLLTPICIAEGFSFVMGENSSFAAFDMIDAFVAVKDFIANRILSRCIQQMPKPHRSAIFESLDEINRSIAKTSTCL